MKERVLSKIAYSVRRKATKWPDDNEKIGGRRKKSANRTNLNPLKDKGFKKRCKKSKKTSKKVLTEKRVRGIMYKLA